jgi:anti-sigma-K factor RskA
VNADVHTLTGAYALDALEDTERDEFERHLVECPECSREVTELRLTANRLGAAVSEQPSDLLRQRVLAEISRVRQDPPPGPRLVAARANQRFRGANRWAMGITSVAAAIALALAGTFGVAALRAQHELGDARAALSAAAARYAPVGQVLSEPDAQTVTASGPSGGNGTVMMSRKLNKGIFLAFNMPPTPANRTYQAWAIGAAGDARSLGVLMSTGGTSTAPVVMNTLGGTAKVGVTVEPAGGSKQPTTTPLMLFDLPT